DAVIASHYPNRAVIVFTKVLEILKAFQLELRSDDATLQVNDPAQSKYPKPTRVVAEGIHDLPKKSPFCNRTAVGGPVPGSKANTVEGGHIAGYEPEKTIRCLRNAIPASRSGTISQPPGGMYVLGDPLVRIEGISRACQ